MTFDTDSATVAAFRYYQEHPEEQDSPMPPPMPEEGDDTDNQFGLTGKQNPYVIELSRTE